MVSSSSDLTLDYKPNGDDCGGGSVYQVMPKPAAAAVALSVDHHLTTTTVQATQKLQEFLYRLEEERLKIDAFKRELPLCMQLLSHAMEAYRQQLEAYQMGSQHGAAAARPLVLEEFILPKNIGIDAAAAVPIDKAGSNATSEKASWMVSAQLWNGTTVDTAAKGPQTAREHSEHPLDTSPKLTVLDGGGGSAGQRKVGAFLPFSKDNAMADGGAAALPELSLAPAEKDAITVAAAEVDKKPYVHDAGGNNGVVARRDAAQSGTKPTSTALDGQSVPPPPPPLQTHRKARRCWSPELHRRFVNALQILGGAQVATPKQIRELMKVDGLTNDEVKSHLQKYRLHTRRPVAAPPTPTAPAPQLVVLGGIWVPPEYATHAATPAIYGAHPATQPHYTAAVAVQEYYHHQSPASVHHHLPHHPEAAAMAVHHRAVAPPPPPPLPPFYKSAARVGSPDSEGHGSGGGRERSESIEEEGEGEGEEREDDEDEMAAAANKPDADAVTTSAAAAIRF
ncbi:hypothetical protein GUJ93_ZPchr0008g13104 [Zizania palustris]|uniref:HTH myb-type domain-containing protein n=1 Tax=Zizania palustris TaxID=103762 RepID=A0A8J5RV04_ZIZPA|nr:hypothetical protein GUJ93_ZPchr0008g13104 [Zizania palustris]